MSKNIDLLTNPPIAWTINQPNTKTLKNLTIKNFIKVCKINN